MTLFLKLAFLPRAMLGMAALLLCVAEITGIVLSFAVRRYRYAGMSLALFLPSYLLWQVTHCRLYLSEQELTSALYIRLSRLPWICWLLALLLLMFGSAFVLYSIIRYARTSITPLTIERCADELSCAICYWQDNGHVVFSNDCMNSLSTQLTGKPLMDGKRLREAITDRILPVGDRVWQFSFHDIAYGGQTLHELIASDISELYAESDALRADNKKLEKMKEELKAYGLKIDETVRRQEMLQAKVNIHDEMNRLMLSTIAADMEDRTEMNHIFALWEQNALLLCMQSNEDRDENAAAQLHDLAQALGIQLRLSGELTENLTEKQKELVFLAAKEAITNAVKHAQAGMMKISFDDTPNGFRCTFENDGNIPKNEVRFTGGLANLSVLAEEQSASVCAEAGEAFRLSLTFPQNR